MMKHISFIRIIVALAICSFCSFGCTKEQDVYVELGKVEFKAEISDKMEVSKAFISNLSDGKASLSFSVGDQIKLVYSSGAYDAEVTAISSGIATITSSSAPTNLTLIKAWYPGENYSDGTMSVPSVQADGELPIVLSANGGGTSLTFSTDPAFTFLCFPVKGDITITEAYLYYRDKQNFFSSYDEVCPPDYTLTFTSPVALNEEIPKNLFFAVPTTAAKYLAVEVKANAPSGALVSSYKLVRRKKSTADISNGNGKVMPALLFSAATDFDITNQRWAGATLISDGIDDRSSKGENTYTLNGNIVECELYASGNYQKFNMYLQSPKISGKIYPGNHRIVAIKSNVVYAFNNPADGSIPQSAADWDFRLSDAESTGTKSFQFIDGTRYRKSGEIDCGSNVKITWFDLMQEFNKYYFPTNMPVGNKGCYFVQQIIYKNALGDIVHPNITCDIYWVGFFNSYEEMLAYEASL